MWHLTYDMWLVTSDTWQVIFSYFFFFQKVPNVSKRPKSARIFLIKGLKVPKSAWKSVKNWGFHRNGATIRTGRESQYLLDFFKIVNCYIWAKANNLFLFKWKYVILVLLFSPNNCTWLFSIPSFPRCPWWCIQGVVGGWLIPQRNNCCHLFSRDPQKSGKFISNVWKVWHCVLTSALIWA